MRCFDIVGARDRPGKGLTGPDVLMALEPVAGGLTFGIYELDYVAKLRPKLEQRIELALEVEPRQCPFTYQEVLSILTEAWPTLSDLSFRTAISPEELPLLGSDEIEEPGLFTLNYNLESWWMLSSSAHVLHFIQRTFLIEDCAAIDLKQS
jgi:hypothetical protein